MTGFLIRRLALAALVLLAVSALTFLIFNVIPNGDPAARMAGRSASAGEVEAIRREWGFDRSLPSQYATTMRKVVTGDLRSYFTRLDVGEEIARGVPRTISLAAGSALLSIVFAIGLGLLGALRRGGLADRATGVLAVVAVSLPIFWVGALLSHFLGAEAGILPSGGYVPLTEDPLRWAEHLVLPWTTLGLLLAGFYARVVRASVIDTLEEDFVRTARAKGISERRVLARHVLPASLVPLLALWGLDLGAVIGGGAVLTESVFDLQGVGQYTAEAIGQLDVPPVLAVTLFGAFFVVAVNAVVDLLYAALDPRVRLG